jgi:hypothetical protein
VHPNWALPEEEPISPRAPLLIGLRGQGAMDPWVLAGQGLGLRFGAGGVGWPYPGRHRLSPLCHLRVPWWRGWCSPSQLYKGGPRG